MLASRRTEAVQWIGGGERPLVGAARARFRQTAVSGKSDTPKAQRDVRDRCRRHRRARPARTRSRQGASSPEGTTASLWERRRGLEGRLIPAAGFPIEFVAAGALKQVSMARRFRTFLDMPQALLAARERFWSRAASGGGARFGRIRFGALSC